MRSVGTLGALTTSICLAGCGDNLPPDPLYAMTQITDETPFSETCGLDKGNGTNYFGVEVQPQIAVDPKKAKHLVGAWQQDRWSNGGARGIGTAMSDDGGATWTIAHPHIGPCAGGTKGAATYARATTPWVAFAADSTAWLSALAFDILKPRSAVVVAKSADGGKTWPDPTILRSDSSADVFNDRQTLTADPSDADKLYVVWDRMAGLSKHDRSAVSSAIWLARHTSDGWSDAQAIYDPGAGHQCVGPVLAALPDGALILAFDEMSNLAAATPDSALTILISHDNGVTWSDPQVLAAMRGATITDANHVPIRSGTGLPSIAVRKSDNTVFLAWEDMQTSREVEAIYSIHSSDDGATWSNPVIVNGAHKSAAFTPAVAVTNKDGVVGVFYYDLRNATESDFVATAWLATSKDSGATWTDAALGQPFPLAPALLGDAYYLGDSQGLGSSSSIFVPLFAGTHKYPDERTDVFVRSE